MSRLTDFRHALADLVRGLPVPEEVDFQVRTGETAYGEGPEPDLQVFVLIGVIGPPSDATEELLDDLLDPTGGLSVKQVVEEDRHLGGAMDVAVVKTSGVRAYPQPNGDGPHIGAEWKINVLLGGP